MLKGLNKPSAKVQGNQLNSTPKLFLGIPINQKLSSSLSKLNPEIKSLFVSNKDPYLHEINVKGQSYLGKYIIGVEEMANLEQTGQNIISVLKKLSHHHHHSDELIVIPLLD